MRGSEFLDARGDAIADLSEAAIDLERREGPDNQIKDRLGGWQRQEQESHGKKSIVPFLRMEEKQDALCDRCPIDDLSL